MKDKLEKALAEISDSYIADAANYKKKRHLAPWLGAVAAVLAVCICAGVLWRPIGGADPVATLSSPAVSTLTTGGSVSKGAHIKYAIASPIYPKVCAYPTEEELMRNGWDTWRDGQKALHNQPDGYANSLRDYFASSTALLLGSGSGENAACSPVNIYMALAMLAEVTDGESRGQLLELLNADSIEALHRFAPRRIVYVSCDPATLARDVALLKERGYALKNAMAADLFPRCSHVESIVTMVKADNQE